MFDRLFFLIGSAFSSLRRNFLLTLASVSVLSICLVILGTFVLLISNITAFVDTLGSDSQIVVFIDENVDEDGVAIIYTRLKQIQNISSVSYVSRDQAFERYKASLGDDTELFSDIDSSILRDSFECSVYDVDKFEQTLFEINKISGIARIRERSELVSQISRVKHVLSFFAIWIVILLLVVSVLVIMNTIKLSVFSRRNDIYIMKCVGATDSFIKAPYFIEGFIIGLISALLSVSAEYFMYERILSPIISDLNLISPVPYSSNAMFIIVFFFVSGPLIGILGSISPVKKHVKETEWENV